MGSSERTTTKTEPTHSDQLFEGVGESYVFATCSLEAVPVCFLAGILAVVEGCRFLLGKVRDLEIEIS